MPETVTITLDRDAAPVFPARCICCGAERPGSTLHIGDRRGLWRRAARHGYGPVEAPACWDCRVKALGQRRTRRVLWVLGCAAVVLVFFFVIPRTWSRAYRKVAGLGAAVVLLGPLAAVEIRRPRALVMEIRGRKVEYEFADARYAGDFRGLNQRRD